jgi:hypothetical protein
VTGAIFALVEPSRGTFRAQPEVADVQQRMRVGVDMLSKDLVMAGAGVYMGANSGSLINFFPPVMPFRMGQRYPGEPPGDGTITDRITIAYIPNTPSQAAVRDAMPKTSREIKVFAQASCGGSDVQIVCPNGETSDGSLCGFCKDDRVVVFDGTGYFDFLTITKVNADNGTNPGPLIQYDKEREDLSKHYCPEDLPPMVQCEDPGHSPQIAKVETHTYFREGNQLFHYAGGTEEPVPIVDNVVDLQFQYFVDPNPPVNVGCQAARDLPVLPSNGSSLVEMSVKDLVNGPYCPEQAPGADPPRTVFDADLYRVRKVRVLLRVQTGLDDLRGRDAFLFRNPGASSAGTRFVPDYELSFEITPRNMNLGR